MFKTLLAAILLFSLASISAVVSSPIQGDWQNIGNNYAVFHILEGPDAEDFEIPEDMELIRSLELPAYDLTYERYQQYFGNARARVIGGQLTIYREDSEKIALVIGNHYPNIAPTNSKRRSKDDASQAVDRDVGRGGQRTVDLTINPKTGRQFYLVETRRFSSRWFHWIDADDGTVLRRYNGLVSGGGTGVKSDTKSLLGPDAQPDTEDDLTIFKKGNWNLQSRDGRQLTYDAGNVGFPGSIAKDKDDSWNLITGDRSSPGQPALVDAHFYGNTADTYFQERHGFDWAACYSDGVQSVVHFSSNYNNAFWNGTYIVYGDGDGSTRRQYSGALDMVAHEQAHGVTECTSNLIYQGESGALNESFSDIFGSSVEFFANESLSSNCVRDGSQVGCADWWIGEDIDLTSDQVPGFRNMANPAEDADPDHYDEYQSEGGVHSNSGIPNHAFYLLVNGGRNAGEALGHNHSGPTVSGIGLADAERIFFMGFTCLPQDATLAQARSATEIVASSLFGSGSTQRQSTTNAWLAVGVGPTTDPPSDTTPPAAPPAPDLASGSDSGSSNRDNVTNVAFPTFNGTAEPGSGVSLFAGQLWLGSGVANGGNYTITIQALGEGNHDVYAKATDAAGNVSEAGPALNVLIDTLSPTGGLIIDSDQPYTNSESVRLDLTASDSGSGLDQMTLSNVSGPLDSWQVYSPAMNWNLTSGDGVKSVYGRFQDLAGNLSLSHNDTIVLDTTPPSGSILINNNAEFTNTTSVTLRLTAIDATSGPATMAFSNDGIGYSAPEPYAITRAWTLSTPEGIKQVFVKYQDAAGNEFQVLDTIVLDTGGAQSDPLVISPSTDAVVVGGQINFTASGGNGDYLFRMLDNNSGATIQGSTGLYTAGNTSGVSDTVSVTDGEGTSMEAYVNVLPALTISPSNLSAQVGEQVNFSIAGGVGGNLFTLPINNSGASMDGVTGLYTAGATSGGTDTIRVSDDDGNTAFATVSVIALPAADTITVVKANYNAKKQKLVIEATSSAGPSVTLSAWFDSDGDKIIFDLPYNSKRRRYIGEADALNAKPDFVVIASSGGGIKIIGNSEIGGKG